MNWKNDPQHAIQLFYGEHKRPWREGYRKHFYRFLRVFIFSDFGKHPTFKFFLEVHLSFSRFDILTFSSFVAFIMLLIMIVFNVFISLELLSYFSLELLGLLFLIPRGGDAVVKLYNVSRSKILLLPQKHSILSL